VGCEVLRFGEVRDFPLADLLDLPGTAGEEADLEGVAVADGFLLVRSLGTAWAFHGVLLVMAHSSELPKPNRLSRLVNRLKIETYSPTVAST
jgi:hypothetical protein